MMGGFGWGRGGQVMMMPVSQPVSDQMLEGFSVAASGTPIQDTPAGEAIKHIQARDWLQAIQAIEALSEEDERLVMDGHGVLRPLSTLKSALLTGMPKEGLRTFRKLNDPAAKTKLQQAQALDDLQQRARAYEALIRDYPLCGPAADAAMALGDTCFEQGRFDRAADLFRFAAEHAEAPVDDPMLMARRLIAMSRAEQWRGFDTLSQYAAFRHADTPITLGGQSVTIPKLIAQLNDLRGNTPEQQASPRAARLAMPTEDDERFDIDLIGKSDLKLLEIMAVNNRLGTIIDKLIAPSVASDNGQVFSLALGCLRKHDPETGSVIWQQEKENQQAYTKKLSNQMYQLQQGYHQSLQIVGDRLLAVVPEANNPARATLNVHDIKTGEKQWSFRQASDDSGTQCVVGKPLIVDDRVYVVTQQQGQGQLRMSALKLSDGQRISKTDLGTAPVDQYLGGPAELEPRIKMGQDLLFVQTNNGALIALDPQTLKIRWAFTQRIRASGMGMLRRHGFIAPGSIPHHTGNLVAAGGIVYTKDTRTNRIHAIREHDAAQLWAQETDGDATIVHADSQHVYVLGKQLVAYDLRTGEQVWWTPHAGAKAGTPVFSDTDCLLAGNNRICHIDLKTGKLTAFREDLNDRAELALTDDLLLRQTGKTLTGYRIPTANKQP